MAVQSLWFEDNVIDAMKRARIHTELTTQDGKVTYKHEQDLPEVSLALKTTTLRIFSSFLGWQDINAD